MKIYISILVAVLCSHIIFGQSASRWQQEVKYTMNVELSETNHIMTGTQTIMYTNNSPDTLNRVFYHLYFNAFQPLSMMDVRSNTLPDPDRRVSSRIGNLKNNEMGYHFIESLFQDGDSVQHKVEGTILEVDLPKPILPGASTKLTMSFQSQVPVQIRRSGRDNSEGIDYTMAQWYPKLCEYDYQGWHANPYIGREFHGIWGDYDVSITMNDSYVIAASGVLQNPNASATDGKKTWRYLAENVHDFAWGADPDYKVVTRKAHDGTIMNFYYQPGERTNDNWEKLPEIMDVALEYMNSRFGKYPYPVYNFVQGGDGGMEYPMLTFITGFRNLGSLVGVSVHEWMHSWYQMVLGTNESLYAWMDEGFTSFGSTETMNYLKEKGMLGETASPLANPFSGTYNGYKKFAASGLEEALSTHADHFRTNRAYGVAAYTKGAIFLRQLEYIIGEEAFAKGLLWYFNTWKFKHPNDNDFIRIMEKVSNIELDWYREYWVNSTHHPDYAVYDVEPHEDNKSKIIFVKDGKMPMPLDVLIEYVDGTNELYNIPLRIMRGEKKLDNGRTFNYMPDWPWTHPVYTVFTEKSVKAVTIDPDQRMIDMNRDNNTWTKE